MVELVTFLTGSVFLYFALQLFLMKTFYDLIKNIFSNKYTLGVIFLIILGLILIPDIVYPYVKIAMDYFINGLIGLYTYIWNIIKQMISSFV